MRHVAIFKLTKKQEGVLNIAFRINADTVEGGGEPGMVIGQFFGNECRVGVINSEQARKIQKIVGTPTGRFIGR